MRQSHTAVIARNETWAGAVETEPYEVAWAGEMIVFLRVLEAADVPEGTHLRVQISPDGMHWCDEGSTVAIGRDPEVPTFVRVAHFGGWMRLVGEVSEEAPVKVVAYVVSKA